MTAARATFSRAPRTPNLVREHRQRAGLTATALASLAGIDRVTLWRIERGHVLPTAATLAAIALALDVAPRDLIGTRGR